MRAGVRLLSRNEGLTLRVVDENNQSICEDGVDVRTKCDFKLRLNSTFEIIIDNVEGPLPSRFSLCAY